MCLPLPLACFAFLPLADLLALLDFGLSLALSGIELAGAVSTTAGFSVVADGGAKVVVLGLSVVVVGLAVVGTAPLSITVVAGIVDGATPLLITVALGVDSAATAAKLRLANTPINNHLLNK